MLNNVDPQTKNLIKLEDQETSTRLETIPISIIQMKKIPLL